ncbi:hypothetical protein CKAH01_01809 [Colletotrichum kahawae]|uniref:Uncharacterized protein n=1 Tax=Colletotrichum kahawae TaxID=34407 RepID=A0AAD9Y4F8_COLKA|nr:hypothetical protein CKAH01_01809 [Colletotrichum kahawae]
MSTRKSPAEESGISPDIDTKSISHGSKNNGSEPSANVSSIGAGASFPTHQLPELLPGSSKKPQSLPAWALAATNSTRHLSQPWKSHYGTDLDDPNFATLKDEIPWNERRFKVSYAEDPN